jgi:hypothetical protein
VPRPTQPRRLVLSPKLYSSGWTPPAPSGQPSLRGTVRALRPRRGLVLSARAALIPDGLPLDAIVDGLGDGTGELIVDEGTGELILNA